MEKSVLEMVDGEKYINSYYDIKAEKMSKSCPDCPSFGKHCPHKVNGDPYYYNCSMTLEVLEAENAELKNHNQELLKSCEGATMMYKDLQKAKELLAKWVELFKPKLEGFSKPSIQVDTEQFLKEVEK